MMGTLIGSIIDILVKDPSKCGIAGQDKSVRKKLGNQTLDLFIESHRFHLSSKTAEVAASLGFEVNDKNKLLSLAHPPFNNLWLEWNLEDQFRGLNMTPMSDAPQRVGVLVRHVKGSQYIITSIFSHKMVGEYVIVSPISIVMDIDNEIDSSEHAKDRSVIAACIQATTIVNGQVPTLEQAYRVMDGCLIGGRQRDDGSPAPEPVKVFISHASHCFTPGYSVPYLRELADDSRSLEYKLLMQDLLRERVTEASGVLRFVVGALALINSKEYVSVQTVKPSDKKIPEPQSSKRSPVYDFVDFTAPHKVFVKDIIESQTYESKHVRPQHEVIGHFASSRRVGDDSCDHQYEMRSPNSWVCLLCAKKRWFRREHVRGDPNVGVVMSKERIVKT